MQLVHTHTHSHLYRYTEELRDREAAEMGGGSELKVGAVKEECSRPIA
jgi:hypothetical protein